MNTLNCPHCGNHRMVAFATHSHCFNCDSLNMPDEGLRLWQQIEFPKIRKPLSLSKYFNLVSAPMADARA